MQSQQYTSQSAPLSSPGYSKSGETILFLSGTHAVVQPNIKYALKFEKVDTTGIFIFTFANSEWEIKHKKYVDYYLNHSCLGDLQMDPADISEKVMAMVISPDQTEVFRGQVYIVEEGFIGVYDVDRGRFFHCPKNWFYLIDEEYLLEPFQSFACVLDEVDFFNFSKPYCKALAEFCSLLVGAELEGECTGISDFNYRLPKFRIRRHHSVDPYGLNLNTAITTKVYEYCTAQLPKYRAKEETLVSPVGVGDDGEIYIQFDDSFAKQMEIFLASIKLRSMKSLSIKDLSKTDVYVAPIGGIIYRVKIMGQLQIENTKEGDKIRMFQMDYGNTCFAYLDTLVPAEYINLHLARLPPLCHKVYLYWVQGILDKESVLDEIAGQKYAIKIKKKKREGVPVVVLSERNPNNGHDTTLNKRLVKMKLASRTLDVSVGKPLQSSVVSNTSSKSNTPSSLL